MVVCIIKQGSMGC